MRLERRFRYGLYAAFSALFVTGAVWLVANGLKDSPNGEIWLAIAANMLMWHGGLAMVTLVMLGALIPLHMRRGWRSRKNQVTGTVMITVNAILIVTAFGLYYLGSDTARMMTSDLHIGVGLALPFLFLGHIFFGRRAR